MDYKIILGLFGCLLVALYWKKRGLSFWSGLIWSMVLTPIGGFLLGIIVEVIKKRNK